MGEKQEKGRGSGRDRRKGRKDPLWTEDEEKIFRSLWLPGLLGLESICKIFPEKSLEEIYEYSQTFEESGRNQKKIEEGPSRRDKSSDGQDSGLNEEKVGRDMESEPEDLPVRDEKRSDSFFNHRPKDEDLGISDGEMVNEDSDDEDFGKRKKKKPRRPARVSCGQENKNIKVGRWDNCEHEIFLKYYDRRRNNHEEVAAHIPTRTVDQVRSHAQKYVFKQDKDEEKAVHSEVARRLILEDEMNPQAEKRSRRIMEREQRRAERMARNEDEAGENSRYFGLLSASRHIKKEEHPARNQRRIVQKKKRMLGIIYSRYEKQDEQKQEVYHSEQERDQLIANHLLSKKIRFLKCLKFGPSPQEIVYLDQLAASSPPRKKRILTESEEEMEREREQREQEARERYMREKENRRKEKEKRDKKD